MKTLKLFSSLSAVTLIIAGCGNQEPVQQTAAVEVRGEAIRSIVPEPAPEIAEPEREPNPAPEVTPKPAKPGIQAELEKAVTKLPEPEPQILTKENTKPSPKPQPQAKVEPANPNSAPETVSTIDDPKTSPAPKSNVKEVASNAAAALTAGIETESKAGKSPAPKKATEEKKAPAPVKPATTDSAAVAKNNSDKPKPGGNSDSKEEKYEMDGKYRVVGFDKLASFEFEVPEEEYDPDKKPDPENQPDQIPTNIKALNKKPVAIKGFMLPLKVEDGEITELLIMRDQSMCCYGTVPKINEWVSVKMVGKGVKPILDQAVTIYGNLKVGEMRENGYLIGIYEMDGDKLLGPLEF
ncbi:MAG: hypothetical protein CMO80_03315 [Verrucomicrobiales bacterium]|mgnify:CR=1 FL=1|nr:hypothetical protein [Verrucomicrobiales bacterium]|tara:strand:+ start:6460 stop:7515 length:1056 start_codon:yes stop_codon:yes gene_type:complete